MDSQVALDAHLLPGQIKLLKVRRAIIALAMFFSSICCLLTAKAQEYPPAVRIGGVFMNGDGNGGYYGTPYTLSIDSSGNCLADYIGDTEENSTHVSGSYVFYLGIFYIDYWVVEAVNTDGTPWSPTPPPPTSPVYGPPALWVEGVVYSWASFADGVDNYTDGSRTITFSSTQTVQGTTPRDTGLNGSFSGVFYVGDSVGWVDLRAADAQGNIIFTTAASGMPPALRVNGGSSLWNYFGYGNGLYLYGGTQAGQALAIDGNGYVWGTPWQGTPFGFYNGATIWMDPGAPTVRTVAFNGTPVSPGTQPAFGPAAVWVDGVLWHYVGTASNYGNVANGDYYVGSNDAQQLVISPEKNVTITNLTYTATGTYTTASATVPCIFLVNGVEVYPGDEDASFDNQNHPLHGPPAVWVNNIVYDFVNSTGPVDNSDASLWTDRYSDGSNGWILIGGTDISSYGIGASGYGANGELLWSGRFNPATAQIEDGGIFVIEESSRLHYDARSCLATSAGGTFIPSAVPPSPAIQAA